MIATPLAVMNCPSRRRSMAYPRPGGSGFENATAPDMVGRGDYVFNSGPWPAGCWCPGPDSLATGDGWPACYPQLSIDGEHPCRYNTDSWNCWPHDLHPKGISYLRSEVQMAHVRDGSSSTVMIGEKYIYPDFYATGECQGDNENMYTGHNNAVCRGAHRGPPRQDQPGFDDGYRFGSAHSSGCHFVFCDGSVHRISYSIDASTFRYLCERADGEVIDGSKF